MYIAIWWGVIRAGSGTEYLYVNAKVNKRRLTPCGSYSSIHVWGTPCQDYPLEYVKLFIKVALASTHPVAILARGCRVARPPFHISKKN